MHVLSKVGCGVHDEVRIHKGSWSGCSSPGRQRKRCGINLEIRSWKLGSCMLHISLPNRRTTLYNAVHETFEEFQFLHEIRWRNSKKWPPPQKGTRSCTKKRMKKIMVKLQWNAHMTFSRDTNHSPQRIYWVSCFYSCCFKDNFTTKFAIRKIKFKYFLIYY